MAAYAWVSGPTSADIRIDTGDLRYRYFGLPLRYKRMPEPTRSALIELSRRSEMLSPEWYQCAVFPLPTSNHPDRAWQSFYRQVFVWIDEDPEIARALAEDIARHFIEDSAESGLDASIVFFSPWVMEWDDRGGWKICADWRDEPGIQRYLKSKGLAP